jgi:hypothetical protein
MCTISCLSRVISLSKRQTLSKTDDEDSSKDDFKGDDDTQSCSKLMNIFRPFIKSNPKHDDCHLQIPTRKSRVKDANFHQMMCPIQRPTHVVKTITRPVQPTIINQILTKGRTVRCRGRHQIPQSNWVSFRMPEF